MVRLKLKFLKSSNALIALLISLLGFSVSCEPKLAYGSPTAHYVINGKVESAATNTVVPEIIVEMRTIESRQDQPIHTRLADTGFSNETGAYSVLDAGSPLGMTYQIKFTDTDGALNGEYEPLDTVIVFKDPEFTGGDGDWFHGTVEREVNIKLKPKS